MARTKSFDPLALLSHLPLAISIFVSLIGFFVAFIEILVESHASGPASPVGVSWFSIFLQVILTGCLFWVIACGTLAVHRYAFAIWTAIALVFAVIGVDKGIYGTLPDEAASKAMGAGYLLLCLVDIFWLLYFSSDESSFAFRTIDSFSNGSAVMSNRQISGPLGMHARGSSSSVTHINQGISSEAYQKTGFANGYSDGPKAAFEQPYRKSAASLVSAHSNVDTAYKPANPSVPPGARTTSPQNLQGPGEPLMAAATDETPNANKPALEQSLGKAKALYAYTASLDDPTELTFNKGETLDIIDKAGKWWRARKPDGTEGIVPSNYVSQIE